MIVYEKIDWEEIVEDLETRPRPDRVVLIHLVKTLKSRLYKCVQSSFVVVGYGSLGK